MTTLKNFTITVNTTSSVFGPRAYTQVIPFNGTPYLPWDEVNQSHDRYKSVVAAVSAPALNVDSVDAKYIFVLTDDSEIIIDFRKS